MLISLPSTHIQPLFLLVNFVLLFALALPAAGQFRYDYIPVKVASEKTADAETAADPIPDDDSTVGVQGGRYGIGGS